MKIINAVWEKRNLEKETKEIEIERTDCLETVRQALEKIDGEYLVLKIPAGEIDKMFCAEEAGFKYIETVINVSHNLREIELPPVMKRINNVVSHELMDRSDMEELFEQIQKGMFQTDRVAIDPVFGLEMASKRYIYWLNDEEERGTELFKLVYKGENIGFFAFKETEPAVFYPFLAGIYPKYQKSNFGCVFNYRPIMEARKRNGKMISTFISTNNSNAMRMHAMLGFQFNEIQYVYIKHNEENSNV